MEYSKRKRLFQALNCDKPDRVPIVVSRNIFDVNIFTTETSYASLIKHARLKTEALFKVHAGSIRYLDPFPRFNPHMAVSLEENSDGTTLVRAETPKGMLYKEMKNVAGTIPEVLRVTSRYFIQEKEDISRYLSIPYDPADIGIHDVGVAEQQIGNNGLVEVSLWDPLGAMCDQIQPEQFAVWSVLEKGLLKDFIEALHERICEELRRLLESGVGEVFYFNGPEFVLPPNQSPEAFDEYIVPYDTELVDLVHQFGKIAIMHSHGKVSQFIDAFVNMGIDALHPVEPPPMGDVDVKHVKQKYGNHLCLIGNIEYAELTNCEEEHIVKRVYQLIQDAGKEGGLIVSPCSGLYEIPLPEKTASNYIAMMNAVHRYGIYSHM
jgi:uroporphyrinogen-III decarboxylase